MVGRLSTYAKNRILCLRFQNNHKITHISRILEHEDNIKVSRESVSAFLKKYNETKSIEDKPRPGRRKKLTDQEIELIGELTRLNPEITAPKIKQYLKLNVSSYTILRASKLFEWNKFNPNSNEAKKAAALEQREMNGTKQLKRHSSKKRKNDTEDDENDYEMAVLLNSDTNESHDMNILTEKDILHIKNVSSSPMVFASKILLQIFKADELRGHYVCGKMISKSVKHKKPLLDKRILYIKWLVDSNYNASNRGDLWQLCRRAINKTILHNERSGFQDILKLKSLNIQNTVALSPSLTATDDDENSEYEFEGINTNKLESEIAYQTQLKQPNKEENDLKLLHENEIINLRHSTCSPMIFATKLLFKVFTSDELHGHSVANNWFKNEKRYIRSPLNESKVNYIRFLVEKYFKVLKVDVWKACCKAINRAIRKSELKNNENDEKFNDLQQLASFAVVSTELPML